MHDFDSVIDHRRVRLTDAINRVAVPGARNLNGFERLDFLNAVVVFILFVREPAKNPVLCAVGVLESSLVRVPCARDLHGLVSVDVTAALPVAVGGDYDSQMTGSASRLCGTSRLSIVIGLRIATMEEAWR